jgi:hypothetical protein
MPRDAFETSDSYTVKNAVRDWLAKGTKGLGAETVKCNRILAETNLILRWSRRSTGTSSGP